jgi:hypothetical protein
MSDYLKEQHPRYRQPILRKLYEAILALKSGRSAGVSDAKKEPESFCSLLCLISSSIVSPDGALKCCVCFIPRRIGLSAAENRRVSLPGS